MTLDRLAIRVVQVALVFLTTASEAQQPTKPSDISIDAFAQLPIMRGVEISPDGTYLAYIRPVNGRGHLVIQATDGSGKPVVAPPTEDSDFEWLHWANDDRIVFVVSATRKRGIVETRETRLWSVLKDGTGSKQIVLPSEVAKTGSSLKRKLPPAQMQHDVIHWLPDEPNHILLSLDGDQNAADEVRRIDIRDGKFKLVRNDYTGIQNWLPDRTGQLRFGWGYRSSTLKILAKRENENWKSREKAAWWDAGFFPVGFSEEPGIVYMAGPNEKGFNVIRTFDINTEEFLDTVFEKDGTDAGSLILDPLTRLPIGVRDSQHQSGVYYFDQSMAALQRAVDKVLPNTANRLVSMTEDRRKVIVNSSSDVEAGTFSYLNRDKNQLSFLAEAMPGLPPELMSPVKPVEYQARDDLTIPAYLTVPVGTSPEKLPVVVMPHGGPASRDDGTFWFLSQFLASRGYAVFQPNFRGSTGYGASFMQAGRKEWGGKMQEDVTDGANWLVEEGIADPNRMCIAGWSYGGYSAAMGAVQTPDLFQCAASINGVLDLPRLIADDRHYIGGSAWTKHMGLEGEGAKRVSPYHQAERIKVPMLIVQARDDARVHVDQGRRMEKRLRRLDKPVEYVEMELGGHSMANEQARRKILASLDAFLGKHLQE